MSQVIGKGAGQTTPDWVQTGDLSVDLRAERSGKGTGRVYTITVECTDASDNSATSTSVGHGASQLGEEAEERSE